MQRGGALDKARGPSSLHRRCGHNLTQDTGHLGYGIIGKLLACRQYGGCRNPLIAIGASWVC